MKKIIICSTLAHLILLLGLQALCTYLLIIFPDYNGFTMVDSTTLGADILLSNILFFSWFYYLMLMNKNWGRLKVFSPLIILLVYIFYLHIKYAVISRYRFDNDYEGLIKWFPYELILYLNLAVIFLNFQLGYFAHKFIATYINRRKA
jgi:hypothetical protein